MNTRFKYLLQHRVRHKKGDTAQLAAQLAPLEEQKKPVALAGRTDPNQQAGAIVVDKDSVTVPKEVMEGGYGKHVMKFEPVVLVILIVMLTFIAFIAWQISQMAPE